MELIMKGVKTLKTRSSAVAVLAVSLFLLPPILGCGSSDKSTAPPEDDPAAMELLQVKAVVDSGLTEPDAAGRVYLIDLRPSSDFIAGHIENALTAPWSQIQVDGRPLYTDLFTKVDTTASTALGDSWLEHYMVNQTENMPPMTHETSRIIFYGASEALAQQAAKMATHIGYDHALYLKGAYADWLSTYPSQVAQNFSGVESVNAAEKSFVMTGSINSSNHDILSANGTWHSIVYKGGMMKDVCMILADTPPYCVQELLTHLGANPVGNMAVGILPGDNQGNGPVTGQKIEFTVTWAGAGKYYTLDELYTEKQSVYHPEGTSFTALGIEPRIGGTRESSLNWNSGCIFCFYSCTVGITSNGKVGGEVWFQDGGVYDGTADPRNLYAGRFYPNTNVLPAAGQAITIKVKVLS
jgi:rhodanese-related sulfurtransferase